MNAIEREIVEYLRRLSGFNWTAKLTKERAVREGWEHDAWVVSLTRNGRSVTVLFRSGSGRRENGEPTTPHIAGVLASLLSDADGSDTHFFKWADNFGLDRDSRQALDTYLRCGEIAELLRKIFSAAERAELARILEDY